MFRTPQNGSAANPTIFNYLNYMRKINTYLSNESMVSDENDCASDCSQWRHDDEYETIVTKV